MLPGFPKFLQRETEQVKKETRSGKINKADHAWKDTIGINEKKANSNGIRFSYTHACSNERVRVRVLSHKGTIISLLPLRAEHAEVGQTFYIKTAVSEANTLLGGKEKKIKRKNSAKHLKINIVGKIDRHYYNHILSGYCEIRDGKMYSLLFSRNIHDCNVIWLLCTVAITTYRIINHLAIYRLRNITQ